MSFIENTVSISNCPKLFSAQTHNSLAAEEISFAQQEETDFWCPIVRKTVTVTGIGMMAMGICRKMDCPLKPKRT